MSSKFLIEFHGRTRGIIGEGQINKEDAALVRHMNQVADFMAESIARKIRRHLHASSIVNVEITFSSGSLLWEGIVTIIIGMGAVGGAIEFVDYYLKGINLIVNQSVRNEVMNSPFRDERYEFETIIDSGRYASANQFINRQEPASLRSPLYILLAVNTLLLLVLLVLELYINFGKS
jgi:hypothetical protein